MTYPESVAEVLLWMKKSLEQGDGTKKRKVSLLMKQCLKMTYSGLSLILFCENLSM